MNKFVILPQKEERNLFNLLPLITSIEMNFTDVEVNVVHSFDLSPQLSTLPRSIRFHLIEEKNFGPMASVKTAANFHELFNIDYVYSYREEVGVLQFCKALKATHRVGWKSLVNDVFLTDSVDKRAGTDYLDLWSRSKVNKKEHLEKDYILNSADISLPENFFKSNSATPFLFISCEAFSDESVVLDLVKHLAPSLEERRLIVWSRANSLILDEIVSQHSNVINASSAKESDINHYISRCRLFLSTVSWHKSLACYLGKTPYFMSNSSPESMSYYKIKPMWIDSSEEKLRLHQEDEVLSLTVDEFTNQLLNELES